MSGLFKTRAFGSILFAVFLIVLQLTGGVALGIISEIFSLSISMTSVLALAQIGFLLVPVILYFVITKEPVKETLRLNPISPANILRIVLITILIQPLIMTISAAGNLFFENYLAQVTWEINKSVSLPVMLVLTALFPALFEEAAMRGIVLSGFKGKKLFIAAIINGLLFAILHLNIQQGLYAFVIGYIFVYLVDATNSIYASVISHFIINGSQMTLLHFSAKTLIEKGETLASAEQSIPPEIMLFTIGFLAVLALIFTILAYLVYKKLKISAAPSIIKEDNGSSF